MKSVFYKSLLLAGVFAPAAAAFSLFDGAPLVGVPESYAVRYNAYLNVGYDDNVHQRPRDEESGEFVRFGVGASYADYESVTRLSYNARVGAQLYNKDANGTDERMFTDVALTASFSRNFGKGSVFSSQLSFSHTPEPEYAGYYTNVGVHSSETRWSLSNVYSQAIDERWSWNVSLAYSGCLYGNDEYYSDDRQYLTPGIGLTYKASERTTYGVSARYSYEFCEVATNSESAYLTANMSHALSPVSSFSLSAGAQYKMVDSWGELYPNLHASYRRVLAEGLSANAYVSFANENVNSASRYSNNEYRSVETWRMGVSCSYAYSHRVTFGVSAGLYSADYSEGTNSDGYKREEWFVGCSMSYKLTESVSASIGYDYRTGDCYNGETFARNRVTTGLNYTF